MNKNLFCTLFQPPPLEDNTSEVRRAKELESINQQQINRQMQYYKQQSIADQPHKPENYLVNSRKSLLEGKKLELSLNNQDPVVYINKSRKTHCQNDSQYINYKLDKVRPSTPKHTKKLADDAFIALEKVKVKQKLSEQSDAVKIDYKINFVPEYERRARERNLYQVEEHLYDQLEYQKEKGTYVKVEKHDRIPLMHEMKPQEFVLSKELQNKKNTMSQQEFVQLKLQNDLAEEALKLLGNM